MGRIKPVTRHQEQITSDEFNALSAAEKLDGKHFTDSHAAARHLAGCDREE